LSVVLSWSKNDLLRKAYQEQGRIHGTFPKARYGVEKLPKLRSSNERGPVTHAPFVRRPLPVTHPRQLLSRKQLATFLVTQHLILSRHHNSSSYADTMGNFISGRSIEQTNEATWYYLFADRGFQGWGTGNRLEETSLKKQCAHANTPPSKPHPFSSQPS
jgi:hypothetical protein